MENELIGETNHKQENLITYFSKPLID